MIYLLLIMIAVDVYIAAFMQLEKQYRKRFVSISSALIIIFLFYFFGEALGEAYYYMVH
ncbi:hypothetical protein [Gillisia sp. Hel_I_29]|uniref:hypothetical protein n=1 Tax=Gillisia sp. Hel_I_29 TaxID=1249975 RepID=UPI000A3E8722|nr:hypothetical protein [Gillisia sp. Hel_I_29]